MADDTQERKGERGVTALPALRRVALSRRAAVSHAGTSATGPDLIEIRLRFV